MTMHQYIFSFVVVLLLSGCSPDQSTKGPEKSNKRGVEVTPFARVEDAVAFVKAYQGKSEDLELPISESLLDPVGANMAIITDTILAKDFMPDGFEQRDRYRLYKYKPFE